jgi:hypothetical protein
MPMAAAGDTVAVWAGKNRENKPLLAKNPQISGHFD